MSAAEQPNIVFFFWDNLGWGEVGCYGGGVLRGKAIWNIRLGWKGAAEYTNIAPELFDLWQDPGERYDRFMNGWAEKTWQAPQMGARALSLLPTYKQYPNRTLETAGLSGAMFDVEDAQVQQQVQMLLHSIAGNK